tara:strand:- start:395 stop:601 length:207 start_codon:yes stop_codon:yes gene_type:complete
MDPFKRQPIVDIPTDALHFDDRKTGRDQYDPNIAYGPNYKPSRSAAFDKEKRRFKELEGRKKQKIIVK